MSDETVIFLASFPPIQSAIKVGQDGARIQLDVPETEMPSIVRLMLKRGKVLRITVEDADTAAPVPVKVRGWREPKLKN